MPEPAAGGEGTGRSGYGPSATVVSVFQSQLPPDWGQILAFGVLLVLPVLIVFVFVQRWFVQGVATSAVKG